MRLGKTIRFASHFGGMLLVTAIIISCSKKNDDFGATSIATDYALAKNWLSVPVITRKVDLFYLYPTSWHKINPGDPNICDIDNPLMLQGSAAAFQRQATAFEPTANLFAPYYRQVDITYTLSLPGAKRDSVIRSVPALDATAAFDYYIQHFNKGRPFILAGHSQGSNVLKIILSDYMKQHPDVYSRMIAAYVIGYPITQQFLSENPHLKFAEKADDCGVIISYNTQSPNVLPGKNIVVSDLVGLVINPISWKRDNTLATTAMGLGSFMPNSSGVFSKVPQYADARIDPTQGVVICSTASDNQLILGFGAGIYHSYDYPFYYFNLQDNARQRVEKFLSGN